MPARRLVLAAVLTVVAIVLSFARESLGDYEMRPNEDNPAPMIDAFARGDWSRAAETIPAMGLTSIVLRVPAALIAGSDVVWTYRLGALLCMLPLVALAMIVDGRLARAGRPGLFRALTAGLLLAGPAIIFSLDIGHPEEFLGGTLCVLAVLAATGRRPIIAAVLLGLAIGTKQWAILAAFPVLLAIDAGGGRLFTRTRIVAAVVGAVVTVACIGPVIAMNPDRYEEIGQGLVEAERTRPQALLWPISPATTRELPLGGGETTSLTTWSTPFGLTRAMATAIAILLAFAAIPLILRTGGLSDPLALLTGLMALRCLVDTINLDYYIAPMLTAIVTWEALRGPPAARIPVLSILAAAGALVAWRVLIEATPPIQWIAWLAATAPLVAVALPTVRRRGGDPAAAPAA